MGALLMGWLFGLAQGFRHAFEPDHVAAVSTIVAEQRSAKRATSFAAIWGIGHAFMLFVVGGLLLTLRRKMPQPMGEVFEFGVALMLIVLGIRTLAEAYRRRPRNVPAECRDHERDRARDGDRDHRDRRRHGHDLRAHGSLNESLPRGRGKWARARRPLVIGLVHGLAGSGALTALVASSFDSTAAGLLFMAIYGTGAMAGMAALAGVTGVPLARVMRSRLGPPILLGITGAISLAFGFVWGWPIVRAWITA